MGILWISVPVRSAGFRLTVKGLAKLTAPGRYPDGNTLYLFVQRSGARSWVQRLVVDGRRRDIGLGSAKYVTLAQARQQAYENRVAARRGGDPVACTPQHRIPTFRMACDKAAQGRQLKGRSGEARRVALETYARSLMDRRVDRIGREDVLRCLLPIWTAKAATARKVRSWIRAALAWAQAHGHVEINYAGEAIAGALPVVKTNRDHHAALPYGEVGAALKAIDASTATSNASGSSDYVFSSPNRAGKETIAAATLGKLIKRLYGDRATVHGFRSSFRTWASERTNVTRDICEMALAHRVGSDVERSYAHSDLFDKRRALMNAWAAYVADSRAGVVPLHA